MDDAQTPGLAKRSFQCPHCGAMAHQYWFALAAIPFKDRSGPQLLNPAIAHSTLVDLERKGQNTGELRNFIDQMMTGDPAISHELDGSGRQVGNLWLSRCYSCRRICVWVHSAIKHPAYRLAVSPNSDLPPDIRADFVEAARILDVSPRGAAALLRLCIQKLCAYLGQPGKDINADIRAFVKAGLDPRVQKSLDIVRLIGNDAVHPGQIDLRDDKETATALLRLVNLIAEKMISEPKHVDEFYETLPVSKRAAIDKRDS